MNLLNLLLPFKWLILGVKEVLCGIFFIFKKIFFFFAFLLKTILKSLIKIGRALINGISIFFKFIYNLIKKLGILLFSGIVKIINFFKKSFIGLFNGIKYLIIQLFEKIKYLFVGLFSGIKYLFIGIFLGIKYIFIYLFKFIGLIFKYLFKALGFVVKQIGRFINFISKYLIIIFKFIFVTVLFRVLKAIGLFLASIPKFVLSIFKFLGIGLYTIFIFPFVYLYKNFVRIFRNTLISIKNKLKTAFLFIISIPSKIKKAFADWFNNLSFIKDIHNRREMKRQTLLIDFDAEDAIRSEKKIMYKFTARNTEGKIEKGYLAAYSKLDVHSYLLAEEYDVYEIKQAKGLSLNITIAHKIKTSDLVFFLAQLSTYIKSGLPLVDSIKILQKQTKSTAIKTIYKGIIYDLTMGSSFSESLEKQGKAFPKLLVNMIKSSELAGNLSEILDDMADYYDAISKTKKQMKSAMTYPTVIMVFATGVVVFILTSVIPSFVKMYDEADATLPGITVAIIKISSFLQANLIWLILGVFVFIILFIVMYRYIKFFRLLIQWLLMHLPIIGNIMIYNEVAMFSKTFASLWNHNVFITNSMEILSKITSNEIYKMLIFDAITNVARGEPVSASFKNNWAFPIVAYEMLVTGERTGQPGPMMDRVADYYQEEHRNAVNQIKAFIEPALIIFLAAVVGVILLSVVLPMFSIYGQMGV
jgi:type IV pilus assembly protein PilC